MSFNKIGSGCYKQENLFKETLEYNLDMISMKLNKNVHDKKLNKKFNSMSSIYLSLYPEERKYCDVSKKFVELIKKESDEAYPILVISD